MRIAIAAPLALLAGTSALAAGTSSIQVGLVVTGNFASPLVGTWDSGGAARGTIYHFVVGSGSGVVYELVSVPLPKDAAIAVDDVLGAPAAAGRCDLRLSGAMYSLEEASSAAARSFGARYEMHYSIQSALVVASSANREGCKRAMSEVPAAGTTQSLYLSGTTDGRLIDSITGTEYTRTR